MYDPTAFPTPSPSQLAEPSQQLQPSLLASVPAHDPNPKPMNTFFEPTIHVGVEALN